MTRQEWRSRTIEERVDRLQRRGTGPWAMCPGPLGIQVRYRRRPRRNVLRLNVALHDAGRALLEALPRAVREAIR